LCNQDPLGITKAEPKQKLDIQAQMEFIFVDNPQESERMVLRRTTKTELGAGEGGEGERGRRDRLYSATLSQEPRWLGAGYKFILPRNIARQIGERENY
jgi:hypothetical protein